MSKLKLNYTPNKNEFILLFGLIVVVVIVLAYNFLLAPAWDNLSITRQAYENQQAQLETLKAEYKNLDKYLEKDAELTAQLDDLQKMIPSYYSQEEVISDVDSIATKSGLKVLSIAMNGVATESRQPFIDELEQSATNSKNSSSDSKSDSKNSDSEKDSDSDLIQSEDVILTYSGTYEQLTSFLTSFESNPRQVYFRKAVLNRVENGTLTGTVEMLVFSSNDKAPVENDPNYPGYAYTTPKTMGKSNPFTAFAGFNTGTATVSQTTSSLPDFYIILNTYDDNANKILMGKYPVSNAQITSDENTTVSATLNVSLTSGGAYQYKYTLGDASFSGSFTGSATGTSLTFSVLSCARKSSYDKVGITLSVQNNTGKALNIYVKNDDTTSPRFHIGSTAGNVQVIR